MADAARTSAATMSAQMGRRGLRTSTALAATGGIPSLALALTSNERASATPASRSRARTLSLTSAVCPASRVTLGWLKT